MFLALAMCLSLAVPAMAAETENLACEKEEIFYYISYDENGNITDYHMPIPLEAPQAEDHTI